MDGKIDSKKQLLITKLLDVIRNFYQNNDPKIKEYLEKLLVATGIEDERKQYKKQIIKSYFFYSKYLLKNQKEINNFPSSYYENSKKIIELDFIKGYYSLFVINKCLLYSNDLKKNDIYMKKLFKKFEVFILQNKDTLSEDDKKLINKIKTDYKEYVNKREYKNNSSKDRVLIQLLKRNLEEEDNPELLKLQKKNNNLKNNITIPSFLEKLPLEINFLILFFLNKKDLINLFCLNSITNSYMVDSYLAKLDQFFEKIVISTTESLQGFLKNIHIIKKRQVSIKKLIFKFDPLANDQKYTFSINQIQYIINNVNIESLVIENKLWTLADLIPLKLNYNKKEGLYLKKFEVIISNVINDKQKLEDLFILNTCSKIIRVKIVYTDIVVLKNSLNLGKISKQINTPLYDSTSDSFVIGEPESKLKSLIILNNVVLSKYEKVMNYYKKKFIDLNLSFHKLLNLEELVLQNFNITNQSQFWLFIKQNESILKKLELFKLHYFPNIITLFYKLKNLTNLETFSLQESPTIKNISFLTINLQRVIPNLYNTSNIPAHLIDQFLERYMIIPSWGKLKRLTLINTNINKSLFMSLLQENLQYLNISNNHNLIYNSRMHNTNRSNSYLTDFSFIKKLTPNLEILVVAKLHYDTLLSPFDHNNTINNNHKDNDDSIYETLFWSKLRIVDLSFNGLKNLTYKHISSLNDGYEMEKILGVDKFVSVGNSDLDSVLIESLLDSGMCHDIISKYGNGFAKSQYDLWFENCVLNKHGL
ncbi:hypothetical protein ACO0SA_004772 [Hanseniaspora valbyensis]